MAAEPENEDGPDEGPILLPAGATCKNCHYSELIRLQGNIQSVRVCKRHPPSAYFVPTPQGGAIMSSPPQVPDDYVCFEYDKREPVLTPVALV